MPAKGKPGNRRRKAKGRPLLLPISAAAGAVIFVLSALYYVVPSPEPPKEEEPAHLLKTRLANERGKLRRELQDELSEWELKNEQVRIEIERLKKEAEP